MTFAPPPQVVCEGVYYTVWQRRLRPEDQDMLVEFPRVERVVQRVHRVRPPQGFALSQARHQARKVHMLHTMLKVRRRSASWVVEEVSSSLLSSCFQNFLVYVFFLLVVLLLNYSDSAEDAHSLRLRSQLQRALRPPERRSVSR